MIPSLVPRKDLPNAFALNSTGFQVATIAGPALAGLVIKHFGVGGAYLINAGSFLAVIGALLALRYRPTPRAADDTSEAPAVSIAALKEGIAFVVGTPILTAAMLLDFAATFFSSASALLPIFAKDILKVGPDGYGYLAAFPAVGSLIAGIIVTFLPPISRQGRVLVWAVMAYGLVTIGFGFASVFALSAFFLAATGAADTVSTILRQTIRQTVTPDRLRGRMVAINMIFFMGGPQLGEMEAGLVAKAFGPVVSVITGGIGSVVMAAIIALKAPWLYRFRLSEWHEAQETASGPGAPAK